MELPTVCIANPNAKSGFTRINKSDFDPKLHTLWVDPLDHDGDGRKGGVAKPLTGDATSGGTDDAAGGETPTVAIPADWECLHHFKKIALAEALIGGDLKFSDGQTKTQAAEIIIRGVLEQRAAA